MGQQFGPALVGAQLAATWEGFGKEVFKLLDGCEVNVASHSEDKVAMAACT